MYSHAEGYGGFARGNGSHTEGYFAEASKVGSHAEGRFTKASGDYSHAEGTGSNASGSYSHAEGGYTTTSNTYEHAQGRYNHNSENQIFSIGTGNSDTDRRNAVSVLEVSNSGSYTSSFFVQNVGGYDGTNPEPGTNDLATVINNLPSSGGSSETLWKKGTGTDSIVQVVADGTYPPTATGKRAIATGYYTTASGQASHAEGNSTKALGESSHAEGYYVFATGTGCHAEGERTKASGSYSHAEGCFTTASNAYEHAQGRYNHNSENQIFSIGAGNSDTDRRNVVSVLEVSNNNSYTGSVFVQNIGGYDGTNPTPGTNDLATVINNLSSSVGSSSGGSSSGGSSETLWKKGTGTASIVQVLPGILGTVFGPTATGEGAIAIGSKTNASGKYSHAEGQETIASNDYEHAQGKYNHSSKNQIFSVGAGLNSNDGRRNAISVLAANSNSSFFVRNVGGYDGTNPEPGTNDLATVLNNTETWTFTLEDGSTVTKNIRIA